MPCLREQRARSEVAGVLLNKGLRPSLKNRTESGVKSRIVGQELIILSISHDPK